MFRTPMSFVRHKPVRHGTHVQSFPVGGASIARFIRDVSSYTPPVAVPRRSPSTEEHLHLYRPMGSSEVPVPAPEPRAQDVLPSLPPIDPTFERLVRVARRWNAVAISRVRAAVGVPSLRTRHLDLVPHLDPGGTRLVTLARRLNVSKQAAFKLVVELDELGLLVREPDPADRRGILISLSPRGRDVMTAAIEQFTEIRLEIGRSLGNASVERLSASLDAISQFLDGAETDLDDADHDDD
jgi:DNA-binding MarR family transcriptional regulator